MRHLILFFAFLMPLLGSCSNEKKEVETQVVDAPEKEEALRIYKLYLSGQFEAYVQEMASCDGMTSSYRQQMVDLHKQHASQQQEKNGGAIQAEVSRIDAMSGGKQANVFLRVLYKDGSHEEIMLSMVKVGERWRLE